MPVHSTLEFVELENKKVRNILRRLIVIYMIIYKLYVYRNISYIYSILCQYISGSIFTITIKRSQGVAADAIEGARDAKGCEKIDELLSPSALRCASVQVYFYESAVHVCTSFRAREKKRSRMEEEMQIERGGEGDARHR